MVKRKASPVLVCLLIGAILAACIGTSQAEKHVSQGVANAEAGDWEQAILEYDKAIELDPDYALAYYNRGRVYCNALTDYEQAIADFTLAIELDPDCAPAYLDRGSVYFRVDDTERAIADLTKAIELNCDPLDVAYNARGFAYGKQGDYENALTDFAKVVALKPENGFAYFMRGVTYNRLGEHEKAISDMERALELSQYPELKHDAEEWLEVLGR